MPDAAQASPCILSCTGWPLPTACCHDSADCCQWAFSLTCAHVTPPPCSVLHSQGLPSLQGTFLSLAAHMCPLATQSIVSATPPANPDQTEVFCTCLRCRVLPASTERFCLTVWLSQARRRATPPPPPLSKLLPAQAGGSCRPASDMSAEQSDAHPGRLATLPSKSLSCSCCAVLAYARGWQGMRSLPAGRLSTPQLKAWLLRPDLRRHLAKLLYAGEQLLSQLPWFVAALCRCCPHGACI